MLRLWAWGSGSGSCDLWDELYMGPRFELEREGMVCACAFTGAETWRFPATFSQGETGGCW